MTYEITADAVRSMFGTNIIQTLMQVYYYILHNLYSFLTESLYHKRSPSQSQTYCRRLGFRPVCCRPIIRWCFEPFRDWCQRGTWQYTYYIICFSFLTESLYQTNDKRSRSQTYCRRLGFRPHAAGFLSLLYRNIYTVAVVSKGKRTV
jgi:hypothetical protein